LRVYVCPALMDWLLSLVLFAVSYGAGERGMTLGRIAWLGGIFQVTYMAASLASGHLLSRRNALPVLIASTVGGIVLGTFALVAQQFGPLFAAMALMGVFAATFFNSFQSFMRSETPPGGLTRTTAIYTFAWSGGFSLGLLTSGSLYRLGPIALGGLTVLVGGVILLTLLIHRRRPHHEPSSDEHTEQSPAGAPPVAPQYLWAGWIIIFTTMFVQRPILTFYPAVSAAQGIAPMLAGLPLFLHVLAQAVSGLCMGRLRHWLYRPGPLMAVQIAAAAGFLLLWCIPGYAFSAVGISILGAWGGFSFFCAVYYASNAGHRARNIGINEFLVGLGSFASLFVCDWFINRSGVPAMYAVCGVALIVSAAAQWGVLAWKKQNMGAGR
jgi:predicted MFS family arabinose efflux permease